MQTSLSKKRKLGKFDGAEGLTELMEEFEQENLRPRSWELSGEVSAFDRDKDELLDQFIDVDFRAKSAPIITTDTTKLLESIVLRRIKDKIYDDVIPTVRMNEALVPSYRNTTAFDEAVRRSLTEVYEQEFKKEQKEGGDKLIEPQLDHDVEVALKDMNALFKKLDALSHYQFKPSEIKPEVKIVNNMPSFRVEDVGPLASAEPESALLAPEEIFKHTKAAMLAKDERTDTDRKRERRKKKKMQKNILDKDSEISKPPKKPVKRKS